MSQAKRRREQLSRVSEAFGEMLYESISSYRLPRAPEIDGPYMAKLAGDESSGDFSQVMLQAYRAEISGRGLPSCEYLVDRIRNRRSDQGRRLSEFTHFCDSASTSGRQVSQAASSSNSTTGETHDASVRISRGVFKAAFVVDCTKVRAIDCYTHAE